MDRARVGDVELCYEWRGEADAPAVLLVNGLGGQLVSWDEGFVDLIAARGYRVLRFDNRDAGLSTSFDGGPAFDMGAALAGDPAVLSYTLDDMADDAAGLLDTLGVAAAHVVGVSMGGMIAQTLVIRHPQRVLSLASIMSTTGARDIGAPTEAAMAELTRPVPDGRGAYLDAEVRSAGVIGSPAYPAQEAAIRTRAALRYDRSFRPAGTGRQLMAILGAPDRTPALAEVRVPTVVIHGDADPLVTPSGGEATARAIPGARLVVLPGMGHDLPTQLWPQLVDAVVANAGRAEPSTAAGGAS
jgi:pimeloyl-ACP methyl ester carboxylesterase